MAPATRCGLVAALALAALPACAPMVGRDASTNRPATETDEAMKAERATRDLILLPVPEDPTVSFSVSFRVGSQDDPPGKEGLAALTGDLVAQGATTTNAYPEILEKLYPLASGYSVRVDKETTTLTGRTHRDNLETFFGLLQDAYLRPAFAAEDFERLRSDLRNEIENTLRYASDEELAKAALTAFVFEGTPYEHPVAGTVAGLAAITLEDVRRFYRAHYTRGNVTLGLAGGYPEDLPERFAATLAELPSGSVEPPPIEPPPISGRHALLVAKPGADASISFGFPIDVHRGERDFYALWVANSWLGEHRHSSSHLYQVIREDRGLNYGDYSYLEAFPEAGQRNVPPVNVGRRQQIFEVWIRTLPNDRAIFALRAALRELDRLVTRGLTQEEFELTRGFLSKYYLQYATTTARRLGFAVDDRFYRIDGRGHLDRFAERMRALTREEVNAAVRRHLQSEDLKIAIVTGDAEGLARGLVSDAPTPIAYESDKPAEILAEDREIAVHPLAIEEGAVRIVPVDEIFED